jgi:hypothetical protein
MPKERRKPRISVNALTEYLTANAGRRRRIVETQKHPPDYQVIYYEPAAKTMTAFIVGGCADEDTVITEIDRLYSLPAKSDYEHHRWTSNAEALESFLGFYERLDLQGMAVTRTSTKLPKLSIGGAEVSVRPEMTLTGKVPRQGEVIGGINLFFSKNEKNHLNVVTGGYASSLVYELLRQHSNGPKPLQRLCLNVDVFGQSVHPAPQSYRRLFNDIEVACEEISMWWDKV